MAQHAEYPDRYIVAIVCPTPRDAITLGAWLQDRGMQAVILPVQGDTQPVDIVQSFNHDRNRSRGNGE